MASKATLVVQFGGVDGLAYLAAEFDAKRNHDKTTFVRGDQVYFDVWASGPYTVEVSSGTVNKIESEEIRLIENEVISFPKQDYSNTQKAVDSIQSYEWYGVDYGNISVAGINEPTKVIAANADENTIGIAKVSYNTKYDVWQLTPPASMSDDYAILIVVSG